MNSKIKFFHWLPRIIGILAILFVSIFALDSFAPDQTIGQQLGTFFMHLLPSFILAAVFLVAWRWELIGGIFFMVIGFGLIPFIFLLNYNRNGMTVGNSLMVVLLINIPFVVVGVLFIVNYFMKKKEQMNTQSE